MQGGKEKIKKKEKPKALGYTNLNTARYMYEMGVVCFHIWKIGH